MRLLIVAVGRLKRGPERELADRYAERARATGRALGFSGPDVVEIPESRATEPRVRKRDEADAIRAKLPDGAELFVWDERGRPLASRPFAQALAAARDAGRASALVIGGPDGLDPSLHEGARVLSFGAMTLPHQLVRVLVCEQVYRATTILQGHPYHRD